MSPGNWSLSRFVSRANWTDLATGGGVFALGMAILLLLPWQVDGETIKAVGDMDSPAFFAGWSGIVLVILSVLLVMRSLSENSGDAAFLVKSPAPVAAAAAILVLATVSIFVMGLLPTTSWAIVALSLTYGYRRYWLIGVIALLCPVVIYMLFERVLLVLLPRGLF